MVDEFHDDGHAVPWDAARAPGADAAPPDDPIVAEVRAVREALFAEAGYDLDEFVRRVRAAQARSSHAIVTLPPKRADSAA